MKTVSGMTLPGMTLSVMTQALMALVALLVLTSACVPKELNDSTEVGGAADVVAEPPVFPKTGQVPPELLVEGLLYDFTSIDVDLNLWVPRPDEARCAAESIVGAFAVQLSDLGYAPGVDGAGVNDIGLSADQRLAVADLFLRCVDAEEMLGSLFLGRDHMAPSEAACMARGLAATEFPRAFVNAWMAGKGFDPIGEDGANASLLLQYANVCLPPSAFLWNGLQLPGADPDRSESITDGDSTDGGSTDGDSTNGGSESGGS